LRIREKGTIWENEQPPILQTIKRYMGQNKVKYNLIKQTTWFPRPLENAIQTKYIKEIINK